MTTSWNWPIIGSVEDTGIGIAPEDMPKIFDEFYRTEAAKELEPRGTGLGLTIVKQIIETYGGTIEVESEPGKGSRFTFRLPVAAGLADGIYSPCARSGPYSSSAGIRSTCL